MDDFIEIDQPELLELVYELARLRGMSAEDAIIDALRRYKEKLAEDCDVSHTDVVAVPY